MRLTLTVVGNVLCVFSVAEEIAEEKMNKLAEKKDQEEQQPEAEEKKAEEEVNNETETQTEDRDNEEETQTTWNSSINTTPLDKC